MNKFPTIGEYNQAIQKKGEYVFRNLPPIKLIPSRTKPIKVFLFGSGAYAAVFKGEKDNNCFALRCFLNAEEDILTRYKAVCEYLENVEASWKTSCEFLNNEILIKGSLYPILKMDWIEGTLINDFVSKHIDNNDSLTKLQVQLLKVSKDLESREIGHGDLQCGNIIISGSAEKFTLHLIDYDGMYVPSLKNRSSLEKGRSEFQHPKRTLKDFNPEMDRFSFWVMITALEALKFDKTLWKEVMQGGFNTLDNFLFTSEDFLNAGKTNLWRRLYDLKKPSLNFYLTFLKSFCGKEMSQVSPPTLYGSKNSMSEEASLKETKSWKNSQSPQSPTSPSKILIQSVSPSTVMTLSLVKIGTTPLELDKDLFKGRTVLITNGAETQKLFLKEDIGEFSVEWSKKERENLTLDEGETNTTKKRSINNDSSKSTSSSNYIEKKKNKVNKNEWKKAAIFIGILFSLGFTGYHYDLFSSPSSVNSAEADVVEIDHSTIKNLIAAEDKRNFYNIYSYYSPTIKRYWDETYPSKSDLRKKYEHAWNLTSYSTNYIQKIVKVGDRKYNVHTNFTFYDNKREELKTLKSVVHFALDENGKVSETYGVNQENENENENELEPERSYGFTYYKNQIKGILSAEEQRDFQKVYNYFSPKMARYWDLDNPTKRELHRTYSDLWKVTASSSNEIIDVEEIAKNIFHLHTNYSYFDLNKREEFTYYSVVRFEFDENGKIFKVYGIGSERIYPEEQNYSETIKEENNNSREFYGDYIYFSFIDDDQGIDIPLRSSANVNSNVVYIIPKDSKVYVLNKNHETYYKVYVNGYYGYVSRHLL